MSYLVIFDCVDADGLRNVVLNNSNYNICNHTMQSKDFYIISNNQTLDDIPNDTQQLYFYKYHNEVIKIIHISNNSFNQIKHIGIGKGTFREINEFVIDGLESLESVKIGEYCFRISDKERNDGVCRITNCPNLRQLDIGWNSFADFQSFELSYLNSIQSINFGGYCFKYADLSLKGE